MAQDLLSAALLREKREKSLMIGVLTSLLHEGKKGLPMCIPVAIFHQHLRNIGHLSGKLRWDHNKRAAKETYAICN